MSYSGKLENLLVVSLEASERERMMSGDLSAGVDEAGDRWEIILKFYADSEDEFADRIRKQFPGSEVTVLLCGYCIVETYKSYIDAIAGLSEVAYVEKPKILNLNLINAKRESCLPVNYANKTYGGSGVLVAIIDTGINVDDAEFKNPDGTTRIISLWDQQSGKIYDSSEINDELAKNKSPEIFGENQALFYDYLNHGINVCKIACGNTGVAPDASILFVKLRRQDKGFSNTTDMMRAVDYSIRTAIMLNMPVAVNISYGSNYGSHLEDDIQTAYINDVSRVWKSTICVASGNEAQEAVHAGVKVKQSENKTVELAVRDYEQNISFTIWYSSLNEIMIKLFTPDGNLVQISPDFTEKTETGTVRRFTISDTEILAYTGNAKPYTQMNEVYVALNAANTESYIASGVWKITIDGVSVKEPNVNLWLSSAVTMNEGTGFLQPVPELTFTLPSTARNVISVGSYNAVTLTPSAFSGRGFVAETEDFTDVKPDITAPGENIMIDKKTTVTGTSFAVPFVTGAAALLMEWGIVQGNDPYMYGDKLKAALKKGAVQLQGQPTPSPVTGWGRLCVERSVPNARKV
jgi:subtilisin family serine protease